jgi:hypothetical protein
LFLAVHRELFGTISAMLQERVIVQDVYQRAAVL